MKKLNKLGLACMLVGFLPCHAGDKATEATKDAHMDTVTLTPEASKLDSILRITPRHGIMFGAQDATVYGIGWIATDTNRSDVKSVCGDFPAVMGSEVGHLELGGTMSLDSVPFSRVREHILAQYKRGGINTLSWHLNNPYTGGTAWDVSVKDTTNSVVASILEGGKNHAKFLSWLDSFAAFVSSLKTENGVKIPILFRPWHEHTGSWFWWGQNLCTTAQYKALWIMMHDYLQAKGVNNLLYAYSPGAGYTNAQEYTERYPGDKYVDLLGVDAYQQNGVKGRAAFVKQLNESLTILTQVGKEHNKPIALTEAGLAGIPDATWWTKTLLPTISKYPISYVLVWRNAHGDSMHCFAPYPGQISAKDFVRFYKNSKTLFCRDINKAYNKK